MSFWLREVAGWLLVVLGLGVLYECLNLIQDRRIIEAGPVSIIGIIIFRGGIHLLKVAVAARICKLAHERERTQPQGRPAGRSVAAPLPSSRPIVVNPTS